MPTIEATTLYSMAESTSAERDFLDLALSSDDATGTLAGLDPAKLLDELRSLAPTIEPQLLLELSNRLQLRTWPDRFQPLQNFLVLLGVQLRVGVLGLYEDGVKFVETWAETVDEPTQRVLQHDLGIALIRQGQFHHAILILQECLRTCRASEERARLLGNLGSAQAQAGQLTQARDSLQEAVKTANSLDAYSDLPKLQEDLAMVLMALSD